MILGMTTSTFTLVHVIISLVGIGSGFIVTFGLLTGKRLDGWTAFFLATTVAARRSGFFFSVRSPFALPQGRHYIAGGAGGCHPGALRPSPRRCMASDLCG